MEDEELGELKCASFVNNNTMLIGTTKGYLVMVPIKSNKFISELTESRYTWTNKLKVLDNLSNIFFNNEKTLCIVAAEDSDSFALVNLSSLEVIQTASLNREKFFINSVCFNPFFSMTNSELKD